MRRISLLYATVVVVALGSQPSRAEPPRPPFCPPPIVPFPCPTPSLTPTPTTPSTTPSGETAPSTAPTTEPPSTAEAAQAPETGLAAGPSAVANMLGEVLGIPPLAFAPPGALSGNLLANAKGGVLAPAVRGIKISDNESPAPQDRAYLGFNYYDNVNGAVNARLGTAIDRLQVYRETFGVEKTFLDRDVSIGMRLPVNSLNVSGFSPDVGGTTTDVGDLSIILKGVLCRNSHTGSLLSAGLLLTVPTGPDSFANTPLFTGLHATLLQPYLGYLYRSDRFYLHGFTSMDIPTDSRDVTFLFNDVGVGYYLYRSNDQGDKCLTAVIPTFEVHITTPLDHRGVFRSNDVLGSADVVDLTMGVTLELNRRSTLALAVVTPITGPKPFDVEALVQFNYRFGGRMGFANILSR